MFKDLSRRIFLIHVVAFVTATLISAAINLWLTPGTLWFPWVLMGWGIAVATHALALLLRKMRRRERIFIDRKVRALVLLGGAWLGCRPHSPWLVRLRQEAEAGLCDGATTSAAPSSSKGAAATGEAATKASAATAETESLTIS
jgi:pimeloyl-ACP methyl ester carboxylesterase